MQTIKDEKGVVIGTEPEETLNKSIIAIRVALQNSKLKKTGKNKFSGFDYFELSDFLPRLNELMLQEEVNDIFTIEDGYAKLTLIKDDESQVYKIPFIMFDTPTNKKYDNDIKEYKDVKSMQDIQYLGALNTYYKRYLYINAMGITDGDIIDNLDNTNIDPKTKGKGKTNNILEQADDEINLALTKEFNDVLVSSGTDLDELLTYYNKEKKENFTINDLTEQQKKEAIVIMKRKGAK